MTETMAGQDAYTLRCAHQVIGAAWDTASWHRAVVETEFQSATDNPIFPHTPEGEVHALHGGNFMEMHVSLASDALSNAIVVLAGLAERQIARLTDETLNTGLPAFLLRGPAGLNSGLMGAQVTATALLAEMRTAGAASIQSLSTNGANQDVVSMGTIAARLLAAKLATLTQIYAILALAVAQAMDIIETDVKAEVFSPHALALRHFVRAISPALLQDRPLGREIEALAVALHQSDPPEPCACSGGCGIEGQAHGFRIFQPGLDRRHDSLDLDGDKFDPDERDPDEGVDDDTLVEDAVNNLRN